MTVRPHNLSISVSVVFMTISVILGSHPSSTHPVQHLYPVRIQLDKDKKQDGE